MKGIILYTLVTKGGGVDGRDHTDKGGKVIGAYTTRLEAEQHCSPWSDVVPSVIDVAKARGVAMAKLDPIDRLMLGLTR